MKSSNEPAVCMSSILYRGLDGDYEQESEPMTATNHLKLCNL